MPTTEPRFIADLLVVDDAPANLQLLFGMLKQSGYRVRPVASGRMALQAVRAQPPDLVLLDVNMPELNGYEVCRAMKQDDALRAVPVIFISALTEPFDKAQAFAAGGVDYITKPFHLDEVRARIETHLALQRMQGRLEVQNRELADASERLRQLEAARRTLASAIVHDLKSPLAAILASVESLLRREGLVGEPREVLEDLLAAAHGAHRIALNLLDVASMAEAKLVPVRRPMPLRELLDRVRAMAQLVTRMTGHALSVKADGGHEVLVDPDLVRRVLENLLDNAFKYAPRGTTVQLIARADEERGLALRVEARGQGIPPEHRAQVFERYFRLSPDAHARTRRGLGLAFCKLAVEAHGGRIWIEDAVPTGVAFCATIPGESTGASTTAT
jgi:signal transduction histidine kinase